MPAASRHKHTPCGFSENTMCKTRLTAPKLPRNHSNNKKTTRTNMPGQILSPVPLSPGKARDQMSAGEFFKSLNATLSTTGDLSSSPVRSIQESDWDVPAPPPPSPVSFHKDHWQRSLRR